MSTTEAMVTMRSEIYWIPGPWPGRLGILPRPRGGDWLEDEVRSWRASGVDVVASLLTPDEIAEFELQKEETRSKAVGIEFYGFPIPDRGVPRSRTDLAKLIGRLERQHIAVINTRLKLFIPEIVTPMELFTETES